MEADFLDAASLRNLPHVVRGLRRVFLPTRLLSPRLFDAIKVPEHGVLTDSRTVPLTAPRDEVVSRIWGIGGVTGWPSMNWAWGLRGIADKLVGGIGIRRNSTLASVIIQVVPDILGIRTSCTGSHDDSRSSAGTT